MPFSASASSRSDAPRDPRPARAFAVWDHDPEGDVFVPPPPETLPASLRPPRSNDAWLLDAPGAPTAAGPGLVRRGRHAPARDGSESPDVRRLRVRLAQLEPVLDDARRDARLADRARRTAEAERDRARATLAAERRDASEAIEREAKRSETARAETKTAREETRAFRDERDATRERYEVFKAEAIRREKETEAKIAVMERRLREREDDVLRKRVDVGTETRDLFGDAEVNAEAQKAQKAHRRDERLRSATRDAYEAGSRDGERRGREATLEASNATKLLAEAAQDAAHARAADAEARVATLAVRLERARAKAAAERKRAAAAETRRNEHEALCRLKVSAAADALAAAETREGVFRVRLEELLARNAFVARNPPKKTEPTGPPVGSFSPTRGARRRKRNPKAKKRIRPPSRRPSRASPLQLKRRNATRETPRLSRKKARRSMRTTLPRTVARSRTRIRFVKKNKASFQTGFPRFDRRRACWRESGVVFAVFYIALWVH